MRNWYQMAVSKKCWPNSEYVRNLRAFEVRFDDRHIDIPNKQGGQDKLYIKSVRVVDANVIKDLIGKLSEIDPTDRKNYVSWLIKVATTDEHIWEDLDSIKNVLIFWESNKATNRQFKRDWLETPSGKEVGLNITSLKSVRNLESFVNKWIDEHSQRNEDEIRKPYSSNGYEIIDSWESVHMYNDQRGLSEGHKDYMEMPENVRYKLIRCDRPEDCCYWGQGSNWCTATVHNEKDSIWDLKKVDFELDGQRVVGYAKWAAKYMSSNGERTPMYIIFKKTIFDIVDGKEVEPKDTSWKPFLQCTHDWAHNDFLDRHNLPPVKIGAAFDHFLGMIVACVPDIIGVKAVENIQEIRKKFYNPSKKERKKIRYPGGHPRPSPPS